MTPRPRIVRALAPIAPLVLGASLMAAPPASADASASVAQNSVTVRIDPSYQQQEFEGWGTSLVWFANATGNYPEPDPKTARRHAVR